MTCRSCTPLKAPTVLRSGRCWQNRTTTAPIRLVLEMLESIRDSGDDVSEFVQGQEPRVKQIDGFQVIVSGLKNYDPRARTVREQADKIPAVSSAAMTPAGASPRELEEVALTTHRTQALPQRRLLHRA